MSFWFLTVHLCLCTPKTLKKSSTDRVIAAGASEGHGEEGVGGAWAHRQGRAFPLVGGGAAGGRAP